MPTLVGSGMEPKRASGTTSFVVAIPSLVGFLSHVAISHIDWMLLGFSAVASIIGALLGANIMNSKLKSSQLKTVIGIILYFVALKMVWGLV